MSIRQLARGLGVSPSLIVRLLGRGMPRELEAAKEWRARSIRARETPEHRPEVVVEMGGEDLEEMVTHLRQMERALAQAAQRAYKENRVPESIILRREHVQAIKAIYDAEAKLIKINEARAKLISVDRALSMINEAVQAAILVLRRLPEMGRDADERRRLEAFMNGVLAELKTGAADGLKHAA
jgi:hypothetical protein